jgi:hypothetical protein
MEAAASATAAARILFRCVTVPEPDRAETLRTGASGALTGPGGD